MTTQAQTLRQRFEALAKWEKVCSEHRMVSIGSSGLFCDICKGTGKALVLPGLRRLCRGYRVETGLTELGRRTLEDTGLWGRHSLTCCGERGWLLRGDPDTEDGRLLLIGALQQAVLALVDGCVIGIVGVGNPGFYVEIGSERGDVRIVAEGPTALEALVDAAMKLKEGVPS